MFKYKTWKIPMGVTSLNEYTLLVSIVSKFSNYHFKISLSNLQLISV